MKDIAPVILAAGDSTRMGYPKAVLPLADGTFVSRIIETVAAVGLPEPVVVLGRHADLIAPRLPAGTRTLINPAPERGQISSMQLAIAAQDERYTGCLFWPVDQPAIPPSIIQALVGHFRRTGALIAMPMCGGKRGHPVIFHRLLFRQILDTPVTAGAKRVVAEHLNETALLECDVRATVEDIDTPEEYRSLTGETLRAALIKRDS
jgi:molybdenum cofactor cytidylyltransferase